MVGHAASAQASRRVVFVAGAGRSGTSTFSTTLKTLGLHVPQPEVVANETNPRGFGESRWVVDFHDVLLREALVSVADARPSAWVDAQLAADNEQVRERLHAWLSSQLGAHQSLVIKDPRLSWFLPMWTTAALSCRATSGYAIMLRPPTEVVGSRKRYYGGRLGNVNAVAGWVNMLLHTEQATRGSCRAFVRYHELLEEPVAAVLRAGRALDLPEVTSAPPETLERVAALVDPSLRRVRLTWEDVRTPRELRDIAEELWAVLSRLAESSGDTADAHTRLDELHCAYVELYENAEAITASSARAEARRALKQARQRPMKLVASALPRSVRDVVPERHRLGLRRIFASGPRGREKR